MEGAFRSFPFYLLFGIVGALRWMPFRNQKLSGRIRIRKDPKILNVIVGEAAASNTHRAGANNVPLPTLHAFPSCTTTTDHGSKSIRAQTLPATQLRTSTCTKTLGPTLPVRHVGRRRFLSLTWDAKIDRFRNFGRLLFISFPNACSLGIQKWRSRSFQKRAC